MDIAKAFDSVPHGVMFCLAARLGVPTQIIRALQAMCGSLDRRSRLGPFGFGPEWRSTN